MEHQFLAADLFLEGYNCAQAIVLAFADVTGMDKQEAARLAAPFGGGMVRMREVCGAVSGMYMVLGFLYGYDTPETGEVKKELYRQVQDLAEKFRQENGSIVCREILKDPSTDPNPSPRTAEYYAKRPCAKMIMTAARLMDAFIQAHPLEN